MTVSGDVLAVWALLVLAGWATVALCVSAVVAVLDLRHRQATNRPGRGFSVACPACGAGPRRPCRRLDGEVMAAPHTVRTAVAAGAVDVDEAVEL